MKQYKYKVNGAQYDVTIDSIVGNIAKVEVNGIPFEVEMQGSSLVEEDLPTQVADETAAPAVAAAPAAVEAAPAAPAADGDQVDKVLRDAKSVVIVPGYGMALAQAQQEQIAAMFDAWKNRDPDALAEVYRGGAVAPDGSPATVVLRFGYDDGLMYQVEVASGGEVTFEEWSDRDCEIALASPRHMSALPQGEALQLWQWLAQRQVAKIRSQPWQGG